MKLMWLGIVFLAGLNLIYSSLILGSYEFSQWKPGGAASGWASSVLGNTGFLLASMRAFYLGLS